MKNNPHKALRSNWRNEAFSKPKSGKKVIITNRSISRNNPATVHKLGGISISSAGCLPSGSYSY